MSLRLLENAPPSKHNTDYTQVARVNAYRRLVSNGQKIKLLFAEEITCNTYESTVLSFLKSLEYKSKMFPMFSP